MLTPKPPTHQLLTPCHRDSHSQLRVSPTSTTPYPCPLPRVRTRNVRRQDGGAVSELASVPYEAENVCLWVEADGLQFTFYFGTSEENRKAIGGPQSMRLISDEVAGGFNGPYVGMYASSQGQTSAQVARFEWFEYKTL